MHLKHIKSCRVCSSPLNPILDLGSQYLQGAFVKGSIQPPLRKIPLELGFCDPAMSENACGLVQLMHSVPPSILYSKYWYRSGTNQTMTKHLTALASEIVAYAHPKSVLDIGCNDGTFLKAFSNTVERTGVDPSDAAVFPFEADIRIMHDFFPSRALHDKRYEVISAFAMLYDLDDPIGFLKAVWHNLSANGLFVFEVAYLPTMMRNVAFDNICHEHLEYYSLAVLERMLGMAGMQIFDARLTDTNCGSILCFAEPQGRSTPQTKSLLQIRNQEFELALDSESSYEVFDQAVRIRINEIKKVVKDLSTSGKTIHIYGSSTKGNVIIQACELHRSINFAADRNPEKHGAQTLGTGIKIISEEESRAMKPDYYLVLPWHFKAEFLEREKTAREAGVKFIFPFPTLEIL